MLELSSRRARTALYRACSALVALAAPAFVLATAPGAARAQTDLRAQAGLELRVFQHDDGPNSLDRTNASMYAQLELLHDFGDGLHRIEVIPFARVDQRDSRRSHADLRELSYKLLERDYELTVGVSRVFWGVAESKHLVNIVNQVDLVENLDRERFLGQPMVRFAWLSELGTFEAFVMTLFRERTFPGPRGRPRVPLPVSSSAEYQSDLGRYRPDVAARYSHFFGPLDLGLSYFYGTGRDPELRVTPSAAGPELTPHYRVIHQAGLDAQLTLGGWLWKLEAMARGQRRLRDRELAATFGFEYTLVGVLGSRADLGLLAEYNWDQRDPFNAGFLEHDLFVGMRLSLNDADDSVLLAGAALDTATGAVLVTVEADHRLSQALTLSLQSFVLARVPNDAPERVLERDSYLQLALTGYL